MINKSVFSSFCFFFRPSQETQFISYIPRNAIKEYKNNLKVMMFFSDLLVIKSNVRVHDHYLAEYINANVLNYYISSKISLM